jgi:ketosteroid isomerase-like protein
MSRENVELVRRGYEALGRRDLQAFLEFIHPSVKATSQMLEVEGGVYEGRDGVRRLVEGIWSVFPDWRPEVLEAREVDDEVVLVAIRNMGTGVGSGVEVDMTAWQAVRFQDGQAIWIHPYATETEGLEALGLRE